MTGESVNIVWTVHLVNKKSSVNDRNPSGSPTESHELTQVHAHLRALTNESVLIPVRLLSRSSCCLCDAWRDRTMTGRLQVFGGFGRSDSPYKLPPSIDSFSDNSDW